MTSLNYKPSALFRSGTARSFSSRLTRAILPALLWFGLPLALIAQTVTGIITDSSGETLIGVNILIKGTTSGTVTDFDGTYSISVPSSESVLVYSYTGFTSQEITVGSQRKIDLVLETDAEVLDEVVVIGYGVVRKSDLTGSVAKIDGDQLTAVVAGNPTSALQGKLSGVQVENNGGEPGGATNVFVRGVSSLTNSYPLYVIDGTFADNMNFVNPNDIKSIEVLKDASSSAIYGSRAANGVVLVTTKRGSPTDQPVVSLSIRTGIEAPSRTLDYLDGPQFVAYRDQLDANDGNIQRLVGDARNVNTDWQDLSLGTGALQDYGVSVSGGGQNANYYISGNFFDQDGILVGSGFQRYNFRANSEFTLGRLKITESLGLSQTETQSNNWFGFDGATAPILRENAPENDGGFEAPERATTGFGGYNNYALATLEDNLTTRRNALGNLKLSYELTEGLSVGVNLGLDYLNTSSYLFNPTFFMSATDAVVNVNQENDLTDLRTEFIQTQVEPTLSYNKNIGANSRIDAVIGATNQNINIRSTGVSGQGTPTNDIRVPGALPTAGILALEGINTTSVLRSLFGRVNYSLDRKYLFSATIRRDESSRFAKDFRVGYFPSASFGWRVSEEDFWPQNGVVNNLKFRAGYGELGAQNIPDYSYQSVFNLTSPTSFGGQIVPGYAQTSFALDDIRWETSKTANVGLDLGLWDDRMTLSAEYYVKNVSDVLVEVALPSSSGSSEGVVQNVGAIRNSGFEIDGVYRAINNGNFKLDFGFNLSTFSSEVTELPNVITGPSISEDDTRVNRYLVGSAPGVYYGYVIEGVYADQAAIDNDQNIRNEDADGARRSVVQPGDFIRKDLNGDGVITGADQQELGDPTPSFIYGFNFSGKAGNLDFGAFFQGSQGNEIYNVNKFYNIFWADDNKLTDVLDAWTPSNTSTNIPRATETDAGENRAPSDFFVEDGSYLRLRTLEVGYTIGTDNVDWLGRLRISLSAQNLFTLTGYSGYNPDISSAQGGRAGAGNPLLSRGLDVRAYPLSRSLMFGVQASF